MLGLGILALDARSHRAPLSLAVVRPSNFHQFSTPSRSASIRSFSAALKAPKSIEVQARAAIPAGSLFQFIRGALETFRTVSDTCLALFCVIQEKPTMAAQAANLLDYDTIECRLSFWVGSHER